MNLSLNRKLNPEKGSIDDIWLKAAVVGGLWASVEIILGSFLHNLRIPMAGSILASFGIVLMIAFFQIWPERGLIWRAGLICALMKSISPSAVILGPMTGIMMEALLLEGGIRLMGKNLAGYLAGGALALFSALLHKVLSLLILYGFNIVIIYINLFHFASRQINIPEADPLALIATLGLVYMIFGSLAAYVGYLAGQRSERSRAAGTIAKNLSAKTDDKEIFGATTGKFSLWLFFLHLAAIPGGLIIINFVERNIAYPVLILYILFCIVYYKNIIRRFKKPLFWFQLLIIALLAAIFVDNINSTTPGFNWQGVKAGLDMNMRALLVVAGFSALSTELKNPLITVFLLKRGFRQLYLAVSIAFRALPAMMEDISRPRQFISNPFISVRKMVEDAQIWLNTLKNEQKSPER